MDKYSVLKDYFGHDNFRNGQAEIIDNILNKRDVLGIMPTGAGKSMCYQIPAIMFDGITIVVSPLISLMKDQVNSLIQSGIKAAYLNSSLTDKQFEQAVFNAKKGMYKIIYVAPERLMTSSFLSISKYVDISMVAVDEAHCVSGWGHDFRPSYLHIPDFIDSLKFRPVVASFTATATNQVRDDIIRLLKLQNPYSITTGFDRQNLYFEVLHPRDKYAEVRRIVSENRDKCGIIYCATRKNVEEVCSRLNAEGFSCTRYHAGLSDEERRRNQDDFIYDRCQVITATNAFGMGIDKSNVSYVVHYNMPKNIENYYQEAGRAGRDGEEAKCTLLYSPDDIRLNMFFIENSGEDSEFSPEMRKQIKKKDVANLKKINDYCNTSKCIRNFILEYFGEPPSEPCGKCSSCNTHYEKINATIDAQKILSCIYRINSRKISFGEMVIAQILAGKTNDKISNFRLDKLPTFGIMKDSSQVHIRTVIKNLERHEYIRKNEFGGLALTQKANDILFKGKEFFINLPKGSDNITKSTDSLIYSFDINLLNRLKAVRKEVADSFSVPPYIIFSDKTLRDMCVKLPRNTYEMTGISGVGTVKLQKYGKKFIDEINTYIENTPNAQKFVTLNDSQTSGKTLTELVIENKNKLKGINENLTFTQLADIILSQIGISAEQKSFNENLKAGLIKQKYISEKTDEKGRKILSTAENSENAGITEEKYLSQKGIEFTRLIFKKSAQDFIFQNIDKFI